MHNHRIRKLSVEALAAHAATANATAPAVTETTLAPAATASTALNDSSETATPTSTSPIDQTPPPKDPSPAPQAPTHTPAELKALTQGKSATELAAMIKTGQVNAQELVEQAFQQIKTENPALNDVIYTDPTGAAAQVKAVDPNAPFAGVPILIKGLGQAMKGYPGTNGLTFEADNKYTYTKNFVLPSWLTWPGNQPSVCQPTFPRPTYPSGFNCKAPRTATRPCWRSESSLKTTTSSSSWTNRQAVTLSNPQPARNTA